MNPLLLSDEIRGKCGISESVYPKLIVPLLHTSFKVPSKSLLSSKKLKKLMSHGNMPGVIEEKSL